MKTPNISFILLAYNHERFVKEALCSILMQNYCPLEIIVSDDNSSDNTYQIIQDILKNYSGNHTIVLNRNEKNLGIAKHFNKIVSEFCHGDIIITADSDDISFPERTERTLKLFQENPDIMGLSFNKTFINSEGKVIGSLQSCNNNIKKITFQEYINSQEVTFCGSSRAIRKEVMDFFGPLQFSIGNDIFVFNRCLMLGGYLFSDENMIFYRKHENNTDSPKGYTKEFIKQAKKQLITDLDYAVKKGIVSKEDAKMAIKKRINPIIRRFTLKRYSYYHPTLFYLIKKRRKILNNCNGIFRTNH